MRPVAPGSVVGADHWGRSWRRGCVGISRSTRRLPALSGAPRRPRGREDQQNGHCEEAGCRAGSREERGQEGSGEDGCRGERVGVRVMLKKTSTGKADPLLELWRLSPRPIDKKQVAAVERLRQIGAKITVKNGVATDVALGNSTKSMTSLRFTTHWNICPTSSRRSRTRHGFSRQVERS